MSNEEQRDTETAKHSPEASSSVLQALNDTLDVYEDTPPIAVLIKEKRKEKGLSQREFSRRTDVTNVHLSRLERGECNPAIRTLTKLAPFLGYPLETLLAASHYQGVLPSDTPTYIDLEGQAINLEQAARSMYRIDGELFLLVWNFYKQFSASDSEVLKVLLKSTAECQGMTGHDENTGSKGFFAEALTDLKQFILSFGKMAHAATDQ